MTAPPDPSRLGHYRLVRRIGQGGMGTVYEAEDQRLHRRVALKVIRDAPDEAARGRLWREARAAAKVNHPNICQLHEIGDDGSTLYLAMELLEGESLADRIGRGALPPPEARRIALDVLAALEALHANGVIHGDLKPSNVFLGAHAVKLVDFGLAKAATPEAHAAIDETTPAPTVHGTVMGTPGYMSPERLRGATPDVAGDVFAAGALLYEMLAGHRAFAGDTFVDVLHATAYEEPPSLAGNAALDAAGGVVRRALAKTAAGRYGTAREMADAVRGLDRHGAPVEPVTPALPRRSWLVVLPFRVPAGDTESEFLAFGLADAIASSLGGLQSLGVRSNAVAAKFAADVADLERLARDAKVDLVLTGSIMRLGQRARVAIQLVEAPAGTLLWSHTAQVTLEDVFQVQDQIVQRIVGSLPLPLTAHDKAVLRHDVPASPAAYEYYLRANQIVQHTTLATLDENQAALALYLRSLDEDPRFAPAWARLARCQRVIGKSGVDTDANFAAAESSLRHALALNPELPIAHIAYAHLESDLGRTKDALLRLVMTAGFDTADPELFGMLVMVCRYAGLLEASVAAHERAKRLDPQIVTSVRHTYWALGDAERALGDGRAFYFEAMIRATLGQVDIALGILRPVLAVPRPETMTSFLGTMLALLEGRRDESLALAERTLQLFRDPEARFYLARQLAHMGEEDRAVNVLHQVLEGGYCFSRAVAIDPWFDGLRSSAGFQGVVRQSTELEAVLADVFRRSGADRLLGVSV